MRMHLIKEGISAKSGRALRKRRKGEKSMKRRTGREGEARIVRSCEVIYIQTDFQLSEIYERTNERTNGNRGDSGIDTDGKDGGFGGRSVRDRDSSLGSHVSSQFAVPRLPFLFRASLWTGSTTTSPHRRAIFPPSASPSVSVFSRASRGNVPHEYFTQKGAWRRAAPSVTCEKRRRSTSTLQGRFWAYANFSRSLIVSDIPAVSSTILRCDFYIHIKMN